MILGIGIDSVEIDRFIDWYLWPRERLLRIFSEGEIDYCLSCKTKNAERFAGRFAAKEAFTKAWHAVNPDSQVSLREICKLVEVKKESNGAPTLAIEWKKLLKNTTEKPITTHFSLTHTKKVATAIVALDK